MRTGSKLLKLTLLGLGATLLAGCETIPVAVDFPKAPPPPQGPTERAKSASTAPPLTQRYETTDAKFQDSLQKALRP